MSVLYDLYKKPSFINFTKALIDAMAKTLSTDPNTAVNEVNELRQIWDSNEYFKQLTPDQLWTAILVKGLPQDYRMNILLELHKYTTKIEAEELDGISSVKHIEMPLYNFCTTFILQYDRTRNFVKEEEKSSGGDRTNKSKWVHYGKSSKVSESQLESAASVTDQKQNEFNVGGGGVSREKTSRLFTGEVPRSQNESATNVKTRRTYPYLAMKTLSGICPKCYPENGLPVQTCEKKCCDIQCKKCRFFGHGHNSCRQSHDVEGKPIS
jgi:hypothetical protein